MTKKHKKAAYDREYRAKNREMLRAKKAAAYAIYGPAHREKEREIRKRKMPAHVEYCRNPEYVVKKSEYDRRKMLEEYGDYAECYQLLKLLVVEINKVQPDRFERYRESGRKQWSIATMQERRRRRAKAKNHR
jgi:hypothetical protein